jgi:hypothetical protein
MLLDKEERRSLRRRLLSALSSLLRPSGQRRTVRPAAARKRKPRGAREAATAAVARGGEGGGSQSAAGNPTTRAATRLARRMRQVTAWKAAQLSLFFRWFSSEAARGTLPVLLFCSCQTLSAPQSVSPSKQMTGAQLCSPLDHKKIQTRKSTSSTIVRTVERTRTWSGHAFGENTKASQSRMAPFLLQSLTVSSEGFTVTCKASTPQATRCNELDLAGNIRGVVRRRTGRAPQDGAAAGCPALPTTLSLVLLACPRRQGAIDGSGSAAAGARPRRRSARRGASPSRGRQET